MFYYLSFTSAGPIVNYQERECFMKGSEKMKTSLNTFIIIITLLVAAPFSYGEYILNGVVDSAEVHMNYQDSQVHARAAEPGKVILTAFDIDNISGERLLLIEDSKRANPGVHMYGTPNSYDVSPDIYNVPESLVNNISYDFSSDGFKRTARHSLFGMPSGLTDILQAGAAFLTNLALHEFGHEVVANYVDAEGSQLNFFNKSGGDFFLGTSHVDSIDSRSNLSYTMGGEFFADMTFEHALKSYRKNPNTYNKSLLLSSGTDFLWYCFYSFYVAEDNPAYDPITISKETGISREMLFSVVLAKTLVNAYRVYSGEDIIVPYFKVDRHSASLNVMIPFDIGG
jgi:hypothetical protein